MNPPTSVTKVLGKPRVATFLYVACGFAALGWVGGHLPGWLALTTLFFARIARKAAQDLRRYNEWRAEWSAMGNKSAAAVEKCKTVSPWRSVLNTAICLIIIPAFLAIPQTTEPVRDTLTLLWVGMAGYLLWKVAAICSRPASLASKAANRAGEAASRANTQSGVVECVLPLPSSSPTRIDASRRLPAYCARLIASQ